MNAPVPTQIAETVAHAYLPPSGAATWVRCAAAPSMWAMFPERGVNKAAADEGTAAHWVFAEMFAGRGARPGQAAPNGVVVTEEMLEGAEMFVAAVMEAWTAAGCPPLHVEEWLAIPSIHPQNAGTPDAWFYDRIRRIIRAFDFKFGHGFVDEFESWQLIDYVAGIIDALDIDGMADQYHDVQMTIVQPRAAHRDGPVRTWHVKASDLRPYFNTLRSAAENAMAIDPVATPNDGCEHCSGRHACVALQRDAYRAADHSMRALPDEMTPAARSLELRLLQTALERLEARVSGLADSVQDDIRRGEMAPHHMLEQTVGRLAWSKEPAEIQTLGRMLGVELSKPGVLTPTQAKEAFKKSGLDPAIIAAYATNPPGAMKLVPFNSKNARKVFQK